MKITVAQVDSTPGAVSQTCEGRSNLDCILTILSQASYEGSDIVVFPEGMIHGYMSMDLILNPEFIESGEKDLSEIIEASKEYKNMLIIVGTFVNINGCLYNSAAVIKEGLFSYVHKRLLPDYDIFFERRYFTCGPIDPKIFSIGGKNVGICVCEDMWDAAYKQSPVKDLSNKGANLIINISHSPYYIGKDSERDEIIRNHAKSNGVDFLYVNAVGTHDGYDGEIIFEGGSRYYSKNGELKWKAPYFETKVQMINTEEFPHIDKTAQVLDQDTEIEKLRKALVSGIKDYCRRSKFNHVVLGMSGGIDSALAAALCVDALGAENVTGITMPSEFSSEGSVSDSRKMAKLFGFDLLEIPIKEVHSLVKHDFINQRNLNNPTNVVPEIKPLTNENIQPRLRMLYLMTFSNNENALLITTGNKTELALGYCTLYGDMAGGLAVLADIDKLVVRKLFKHYIDRWRGLGIDVAMDSVLCDGILAMQNILDKPPSAELAPDQEDEKAFGMSFEELVPLVNQILDGQDSLETVIKTNPEVHTSKVNEIWHRIKVQEFKRRQVSPGIKVTPKAFGIGRRIPMTHGW